MIILLVIAIVVVIPIAAVIVMFIRFGEKLVVHALYASAANAIYSAAHAFFEVARVAEVRRLALAPFALTAAVLFGLRGFQIGAVLLETLSAHVVHFAAE